MDENPAPTLNAADAAAGTHATVPAAGRSRRRRRPTGSPPPLPHHLQTSGVRWLIAALALVALTIAVFARGMRGLAVDVTVADDAVVRWLRGLHAPGLVGLFRGLAAIGSWWVLNGLLWGLVLALLVLRRFRHLIVLVILVQVVSLLTENVVGAIAQRPRPFGVAIHAGWGGWALPSTQVTFLAGILVLVLYTMVPEGRWRNIGKWLVTGLVALAALGRMALGADAPTDVLVGVALGVAIPLVAFRLFTPSEVFPIVYRRGRSAHLDVGGARGLAIRRGLEDQLGRLHPAADHRQGRPAQPPVRQAVCPQPPAGRPLVQARPRVAVRPPGGREAVQHRAAAGAAGGLRPVADAARRPAKPDAPRVRGADARTGVPAGHRAVRGRHRARRGRDRRPGHRRRAGDHPHTVGRRPCPPRRQAGQPAGAGRPAAADRRGVRPGPPQPLAAGGGPGQHDAVPGAAVQPRAGVPAGAAPVQRGGDHRGVRGGPRVGAALPATPHAPRPGARPARRVHQAATDPAPADQDPALERPPGRPPGAGGAAARVLRAGDRWRLHRQRCRQDAAVRRQPRLHPSGAAVVGGPVGAVGVDGAVRARLAGRLDGGGGDGQRRPLGAHAEPRPCR